MKKNEVVGSMFPPQLAEKFLKYADGLLQGFIVSTDKTSNLYSSKTIIANLYGLTETVSFNTFFIIDKSYKDTPIGKPVNNNKIYLLDENMEEVSDGDVGEIHIAKQLAVGYLNDKKLTDEKFIPNPYSTSNDDKILYKTGDLAYYTNDTSLVFLQRKDYMFNIRGYRVEPSDVENGLNSLDYVKKSIVSSFDISKITNIENDIRIYAGIITEEKKVSVEEIQKELMKTLPSYMIPTVIEKIDSIPLTPLGKIDRKNVLPNNIYDLYLNNVKEIVKPSNSLEQEIFNISTKILGHANFGVTNTLLSIGFTSLTIISLSNKILEKYEVELRLSEIMHKDIRELSKEIEESPQAKDYIKHEKRDYYPLSPQQLSLYKDIKKENFTSTLFDTHHALTLKNMDSAKLKSSILEAIEFNPDIKMYFIDIDGEIYQKICDDLVIDIPIYNGYINIYEANIHSFNLFKPPLFDFRIYDYGDEILIFSSFNHIISDGVSIENFFKDVFKIYFNEDISKRKFTYFDYLIDLLSSEKENNRKIKNYLQNKTKNDSLKFYCKSFERKRTSETKYFNFKLDTPKNIVSTSKEFNMSYNSILLSSITLALKDLFKNNKIYLEYIFNGRDKNTYYNIFGLFRRHFPFFINITQMIQ